MEITVKNSHGEEIIINMSRQAETNHPRGSMVCNVHPAFGVPIKLTIAIAPDGKIYNRGYEWDADCIDYKKEADTNTYLHVDQWWEDNMGKTTPTQEMAETLSGLFSGRIKIDGLKIAVGGSCQRLCPIDLGAEEKRIGEKIYLV
jgi:hypothetical protein